MFKSSIRQPYRAAFLVVGPDGRVDCPLRQLPCLAETTSLGLGVGCQGKAFVFVIRLARLPLLLFRHRGEIRAEEGKSIENIVEYVGIQFSRLRLADDLPRFVKTLQR